MINLFNKWQKIKFIPNLIIGFVWSKLCRLARQQNLVLVGGHAGIFFDDNAKTIYKFLRAHKQYNVYWCYSSKRKYSLSETGEDRSVKIGSIKGYFLYYSAKFVIYSHSNSTDIAPVADKFFFQHPFRVHISHGVEGLKRTAGKIVEADMYTCTSFFEQNIKNSDWKIPLKNTAVTGIARFDNYAIEAVDKKSMNKILYLPTWRDWDYSSSSEEFKQTESYKAIVNFLRNKDLARFLKDRNVIIYVRLHPFVSQFIQNFTSVSNNIRITNTDISELIVNMDVLITDYSSIAVDFFYLKKPVIFYQYDQAKFLKLRGSYLNYKNELFGELCRNEDSLMTALNLVLSQQSDNYSELRNKLFTFNDHDNSQRIIDSIESKLSDASLNEV